MTGEVLVTIVIVSYNTCALLRSCLRSIALTVTGIPHEIIVVDNASADDSAHMVATEFPQVSLVKNSRNLGFARANNLAIGTARGRYLLFLNSDALLKENALSELMLFMDRHPRAAAVGPRILNADGSVQSKGFTFPSITASLLDLFRVTTWASNQTLQRVFPRHFWDAGGSRSVDWISGCCMLLRRSALEALGSFHEDFFMYYEDLEWCRRAWRGGWEVWYCAAPEVVHNNLSSPFPERIGQIRVAARTYYRMTNGRMRGVVISALRVMFYATRLARAAVQSGNAQGFTHARRSLKDEIDFLLFIAR